MKLSSQAELVVIMMTRERNKVKYQPRGINNLLTCHDIIPAEHTHIITINLMTRRRVTTTNVTLVIKSMVICHHHSGIIVTKRCILGNTVIITICSSIVCISSIGSGGHRRRAGQALCGAAALEERNKRLFRTVGRLWATAATVGLLGGYILTTKTVW